MRKTLIIGLGGAGMSIASHVKEHLGCDILAINTNTEALARSPFHQQLQIGASTCQGQPAKSTQRGRLAAEESLQELERSIKGAERIILLAGLGGGTATGASEPLIDLATSLGIPVIMVATLPFEFETAQRAAAMAVLPRLQNKNIQLILKDHSQLLKEGGQSLALTSYYQKASTEIAHEIEQILKD